MNIVSENRCFGGRQWVIQHPSSSTGTSMEFSIYLPPQAESGSCPVLWYLSGLTCTQENVTTKAGAQRYCAEHGLILVCPDTSPRGDGVADDPDGAYDFGLGAGFYVDATEAPFAAHYQMFSYVTAELPALIAAEFPAADMNRQGITGHSMGGHGALTLALHCPDRYRSVSAFAPICHPTTVPWGQKALPGYLGNDEAAWRRHDAVCLIDDGKRFADGASVLVDQGGADNFLDSQLKPQTLQAACERAGIPLTLRLQEGYDHSYWFIQSFIGDHVAHHAKALKA